MLHSSVTAQANKRVIVGNDIRIIKVLLHASNLIKSEQINRKH